jgi:hypothetical protein
MEYSEETKSFIKEARDVVVKAEHEVDELQRELKDGTLDRQKLECGLQKLDEYLMIMQRVPPHK